MTLLHLVIRRRRQLGDAVVELELEREDGGDLPAFAAGAHIDVHVAEGLVRQYSLCQSPAERRVYRIAVQREPQSRGGSVGVHDHLSESGLVTVSEPRNHFPLARGAKRSLLVAGGIGVTPLVAMAEVLAAEQVEFTLHYCARSAAHAALADRLRASPFADRAKLHLDDGPQTQVFDPRAVLATYAPGDHLYVCGPTGFMDWVLTTAEALGWPADALHREYFSPPDTAFAPGGPFDLKLVRSDLTVPVGAEETALDALRRAGFEIETSCEQGVCGTCITRVLDGEPDHRDYFMTDEEHALNDQFTPCCSRSKTPTLSVDL
jgi:vanillate O-demethylase ferredoxin subunit